MLRHLSKMAGLVDAKQAMRKQIKLALRQQDKDVMQRESEVCACVVATEHEQQEKQALQGCGYSFPCAVTGTAISSRVLASNALRENKVFGIYVHAERLREVDTTPILQHFVPSIGAQL